MPSIEQRITEPGAGCASPTKRAEASATSTSPSRISNPRLAGCAEAVLERAHGAEAALALALELEHGVHQVLERPRARERPLLGHVADQQHGHVQALGDVHQRRRRLTLPRRCRASSP